MSARYIINLYDPLGNQVAVITDFRSLNYTLNLNDIDNAQFSFTFEPARARLLVKDALVQVMRSVPDKSIDWYQEYIGFHRTPQFDLTETGNRILTSYSRGLNDLLRRRDILYRAGSTFSTKSGLADNVMKAIVRENVGLSAGSSSRLQTGGITPNFTVADDNSLATNWQGSFAFQNVLKTLQEIGLASSVDFTIRAIQLTPVRFLFVTASPSLGATRPVIFSVHFGNVKSFTHTISSTEEATAITILGQGQEEHRDYVSVQSTARLDSPYNHAEVTKDARNDTVAALTDMATAELRKTAAIETYTFTAMQDSQFLYGRDYFLGDRVTLRGLDDREVTKRLVRVTMNLNVDTGEEALNLEFSNYMPSLDPNNMYEVVREFRNRLSELEHKGDT